jgi:DHA1 family bicyclomycin/chloramphenicol resistance-like MFS transporter
MIFIACGPFLYMNTYGLPIITYCLHQGAIILIFALTSILISPIAEFFGKRKTVILGISILSLGGLFMMILGLKYANAPYLTTLSMMIISIGAAISYPIIFTKSLEIFPNIKGTSSSAVMSVRFFICSIFLMITSYFYNGHLLSVAYIITSTVCLTLIFAIKLLSLISFEENEEKI